jgi:hypothetical protein
MSFKTYVFKADLEVWLPGLSQMSDGAGFCTCNGENECKTFNLEPIMKRLVNF